MVRGGIILNGVVALVLVTMTDNTMTDADLLTICCIAGPHKDVNISGVAWLPRLDDILHNKVLCQYKEVVTFLIW